VIGFNVAQLLKSPTGAVRRVEVDELDEDLRKDLHLASATKGSLRLMRTSAGILVTGKLAHKVEAICSRCLVEFIRDQVIEFDDEFVPVIDVNTGLPAPEPADPDAFRLTQDHLLDLNEAIRQYAILENPMNPLCDENCRGLCANCGANLNNGPCGCQTGDDGTAGSTFGSLLVERMRQAGFKPKEE